MSVIIEEEIVLNNLKEYKQLLNKRTVLDNKLKYLWGSYSLYCGQKPIDGMPKPKGRNPQADTILEMISDLEEQQKQNQEKIDVIEAALALLTSEEEASIRARIIEQRKWLEVENIVGLSAKTARLRIRSGLEKLKTGDF